MTFRLLVILVIGLLASEHGWAQEPVVISVNKSPKGTMEEEKTETDRSGFLGIERWIFPIGTRANGTVGFVGDLIPTLKSEYDLYSERDLNFYACGLDIGTEKLMLDMRVKFAQRNGVPTALSDMRLDVGFSRRWHFRKMRMSKFSVLQRKTAFIQYGISFDHGLGANENNNDSDQKIENIRFGNAKVAVNHPIAGNVLLGVEVISHFSLAKSLRSYVSGGITLSYFFSNL